MNSSGGGLASNERSAVPSTTPRAPTLTATAGDEEVRLTWTPGADGGRRIVSYECQLRIGAGDYEKSCAGRSLGASATSLTLTEEDILTGTDGVDDQRITNGTTYTFRVRAVNARETPDAGIGDWSNVATARPTDGSGTQRTFTISATIDGKSWARAGANRTILATVEVNPRYRAPSTELWVDVDASQFDPGRTVVFGPTNSERDVSFTGAPSEPAGSSDDITIALFSSQADAGTPSNALAVTSVEIRPADTPDPPTGLVATRGDGEVTLSWATDRATDRAPDDYEYRQRRQPGSYGRWTDFAGKEFQLQNDDMTVTSNTVTGLTNSGTYAFQVRALNAPSGPGAAPSDPSDEVSVSLSGTVETGALSAPRNVAAAAGDRQVTLSWTAPAADGGAAISGYQYQLRAGAGAYGQWTTIPGGGPSRSYIVTGLTNGTRYFFRVRAVNSDGAGPPSTEESATPSLTVDTTLRALSLSTVTLAPVTLAPAFTPATRTYTAAVGSSVTQVTVTATPNKAGRDGDDHAGRREHRRGRSPGGPGGRSQPHPGDGDRRHERRRLHHHGDAGRERAGRAHGPHGDGGRGRRGRGDAVVDGADRRRGRQPVRVPAEGGDGRLWRLDAHPQQRCVHHVLYRPGPHRRHGLHLQGPCREQRGRRRGVDRGHRHADHGEARLGEGGAGCRRRDRPCDGSRVGRRHDLRRGRADRDPGERPVQRGPGRHALVHGCVEQ